MNDTQVILLVLAGSISVGIGAELVRAVVWALVFRRFFPKLFR